MAAGDDIRPGERALAEAPAARDAGLVFIGRIRTPWKSRAECPRQGAPDGPVCRLEFWPDYAAALEGLDAFAAVDVLYWLDGARRALVTQPPRGGRPRGTFALRSPARPNPIGLSRCRLVAIEGASVLVRGLDCVDGTPLIDIKPERCAFSADRP